MMRKRKTSEIKPAANDVSQALDEAFKIIQAKPRPAEEIRAAAVGLISKVLGQPNDYRLEYTNYRDSSLQFQYDVTGEYLQEPRDQDIVSAFEAIEALLDRSMVSAELGIEIFQAIEKAIDSCKLRFVGDSTSGALLFLKSGTREMMYDDMPIMTRVPTVAAQARIRLKKVSSIWFRRKVQSELTGNNSRERLAEMNRRVKLFDPDMWAPTPPDFVITTEFIRSLLIRVKNEVETEETVPSDEVVGKPKLSTDQFIMLMFGIGGSRLKGLDRQNVAMGLSALCGGSWEYFYNRFPQVLPGDEGIKKFASSPASYNRDVEKVCSILDTMGLTDVASNLRLDSGV